MLTPVSNPDSPSTSSGNAISAGRSSPPGSLFVAVSAVDPVRDVDRVGARSGQPRRNDDGVQGEEDRDERYRDVHRFSEAQRNTPPSTSSSTTVMATACPERPPA